jgi:hypothetical protein
VVIVHLCQEQRWTLWGWDASDWATIVAAFVAALVAAVVAVIGYSIQQGTARADRHRTMYAEALRAVEDYLEAPYLIRRRDGSAAARREISTHISEIQSRLSFYGAWLQLHAPAAVHAAYSEYVTQARREAGTQMSAAWRARPTKRDSDVPLGKAYQHAASDRARDAVLRAMR